MKSVSDFRILGFSPSQILFAVFAWSLLILRFGYRYGTGDQVELLPYTLFLDNPHLYPHDFFIQGLHASVPNERTVMANLLLPFVNWLEITCFILHLLTTVVLVLGLEKLARRFIKNKYVAWLSILIALIPLNDFTLGNVELYSDCFQASALAVAIVVWALNLFLDKKYLAASVLMSAATFIQLLEGLDVMMVLCVILFIAAIKREVSWKGLLGFVSVYAFTGGVYLIFVFIQKNVATSAFCEKDIFSILFQFRHPHHFLFSAFPLGKTIVFFLLCALSILFFALRSRQLLFFVLISLAGIIVYALSVDGLHNVFIGNFQFYKITQWIKFLGVVACLGLFAEIIEKHTALWHTLKGELYLLILAIAACWVLVLNFSTSLPYSVPFQLFGMKQSDDMIDICLRIKQETPPDAVFIQPFENTELKFYAQRSSYVEFKANVRNKAFVCDWAYRIQQIYGVGPGMGINGFALQQEADKDFYALEGEWIETIKRDGVSYILTRKDSQPAFGNLLLSNNTYEVYKL
ncbi:MAG TPA: DUF6798 domain-containing protein [Chitinophagales bacterium]|nr:DUF6798 domain-containing protein [Chitinophagales bacterium]